MTGAELSTAYDLCEHITRTEARNFSYGIRLLPPPRRQALSAIYAMARRIDDIGDGTLPATDKLIALTAVRDQLHRLPADPDDEVLLALADVVERFPVPLSAFDDLVDGCEADVRGTTYDTQEELVGYCRQVAGSVGRLSLGVFDCADRARAEPVADDLGVALQLTNILRDIVEDATTGRTYLPRAELDRYGLTPATLADPPAPDRPRWAQLMIDQIRQAESWYDRGLPLLPMLDRRSAACTGAMAGIYHRLLHRMAAEPPAVLRGRVRLPAWEKALAAMHALTRRTA